MTTPTTLDIVIPIYNEQETLPEMFSRLLATGASLKGCGKGGSDVHWRIIFVNDGSRDRSVAMIEEMHEKDPRFTLIDLSRNFGHQAAMSAGLEHADGDVVMMMDGDLQDPPEIVTQFLEKWREGYDVVYAVRRKRKENVLKRFAYSVFYRSMKMIAAIDVPLDAGDFCLLDSRVAAEMAALPEHHRFLRGLRSWLGFRQIGVEYERSERFAGVTKYSLRKLIRLALAGYIGFSSMPLRIGAWMGFIAAACGFGVLAWAIIAKLMGMIIPPGWTSLMAVILFIGGIQLMVLGVMGEYLGNIYDEVRRRPTWVASRRLGLSDRLRNRAG